MAAALAAARQQVTTAADSMISRSTLTPFNEALGSSDYVRWRRELVQLAESAGAGFRAALLTNQNIPRRAPYADADVLLNDATGVATLTIPQIRQEALMYVLRQSLHPAGQSITLIASCVCTRAECLRPRLEPSRTRLSLFSTDVGQLDLL